MEVDAERKMTELISEGYGILTPAPEPTLTLVHKHELELTDSSLDYSSFEHLEDHHKEILEDLRVALDSSINLISKCEKLLADLTAVDTFDAKIEITYSRLKIAKQNLGSVIKDFEIDDSNDDSILANAKPEVEIKVEENDSLTNDFNSEFEVKGEDGNTSSHQIEYDNNDFHDNGFDSNQEDFSGKENIKSTKKVKKKRKQRKPNAKLKNESSDKTKFSCKECDRVFISNYHLTKHTNAVHSMISCTECKLEFNSKKDLKVHIKALHQANLNNFVCQICGYTCHELGPFNRHMLWHSDNRPFKCDHCGHAFHIKYHLHQHLRIHTGEKPFECEVCGKQFSRDSHLTRHRITHSGEKSFACDVCSKTFTLRENMKRHMKVHTAVTEVKVPVS